MSSEVEAGMFLPRIMDNTAMSMYMECPAKYDMAMRQHRRRSSSSTLSPALSYGTTWHAIMETHYNTEGDKQAVENAAVASWQPHGKVDDHRTLERALVEYDNYVEKYGPPAQEQGRTLVGPDSEKLIEIFAELSWDGALHPYAGKLDRFLEINGHIYVEDHKTTSRLGPTFFKQFELSNQMMGYAWLSRQLTSLPIAGVRINAHAVYKRDSKFERQVISWSDELLADWASNYNLWLERIKHSYDTNVWPRNWSACAGKYSMCQYAEICALPPRLRDRALEVDFDEHPWNPMNPSGDEDASTSE